jgi:hypothetical protein
MTYDLLAAYELTKICKNKYKTKTNYTTKRVAD